MYSGFHKNVTLFNINNIEINISAHQIKLEWFLKDYVTLNTVATALAS